MSLEFQLKRGRCLRALQRQILMIAASMSVSVGCELRTLGGMSSQNARA